MLGGMKEDARIGMERKRYISYPKNACIYEKRAVQVFYQTTAVISEFNVEQKLFKFLARDDDSNKKWLGPPLVETLMLVVVCRDDHSQPLGSRRYV